MQILQMVKLVQKNLRTQKLWDHSRLNQRATEVLSAGQQNEFQTETVVQLGVGVEVKIEVESRTGIEVKMSLQMGDEMKVQVQISVKVSAG